MRLRRECAEAHPGRYKPLADLIDAFHFVKRNRLEMLADLKEIAQLDGFFEPSLTHSVRILLVGLVIAPVASRLQLMNVLGFESVALALRPITVEPANRQGQ